MGTKKEQPPTLVGIVQSRDYCFGDAPEDALQLDCGRSLRGVNIRYETYGTLNADKSNAILLFHALTGSHHAHGYNDDLPEAGDFWQPEYFEGWWDRMIGPGKPLDTERYFIICVNFLGSCYGSTCPVSPAPDG